MRIQLRTVLDCDPDAAWRALRSPAVLRELYGPFVQMRSLSVEGFPTTWQEGAQEVELRGAGLVPMGRQRIDLRFRDDRADGIRILEDHGGGASGPLSLLDSWTHRMAVSEAPGQPGRTLYRDRLDIEGAFAPVYWYPLWLTWQWRGRRIEDLAPGWAHDPVAAGDTEDTDDRPENSGDSPESAPTH